MLVLRILAHLFGQFAHVLLHCLAQLSHQLLDFFVARSVFECILQGLLCLSQPALSFGQIAIFDLAGDFPEVVHDCAQVIIIVRRCKA